MQHMENQEDPHFQMLAQQRAARARHKHLNPEGFDTEIVCWREDAEGKRCEYVPEFHIEQLDGDCYMSCRKDALELIQTIPVIPLEKFGKPQGN